MKTQIAATRHSEHGTHADVSIDYCQRCDAFHLHAGQVWLTFTKQEFATFAQGVETCYQEPRTILTDPTPWAFLTSELIA